MHDLTRHTPHLPMLMIIMLMLFSCRVYSLLPASGPDHHKNTPVIIPGITIQGKVIKDAGGNLVSVLIPLRQAGKLLLVEATIDGKTGNFILDTGSSDLVLNQTYFRDYMPMGDLHAGGVTGAAASAYRVEVRRLNLAGIEYTRLPADVTNLGHLENRRGVQIFGLIGMNLIKHLEIVIDVRNSELQLHRLDKSGNRLQPAAQRTVFDLTQKMYESNNIALTDVVIAGKVLCFCLDTGAESNVLDLNLPKKVLETVSILRRSVLQGVGSTKKEVLYGNLNAFVFGGRSMGKMPVILTSLSGMSQKYGFTIHGMLGYDFFDRGQITINLVKKELGIVFNKEVTP